MALTMATSTHEIVDPYEDTHGKYTAFLAGGWKWRFFGFPHLYYPSGLRYREIPATCFHDQLGRQRIITRPFDGLISPADARLETLYVQATDSICKLSSTSPNCTWKRTVIRNVSPFYLRVSNMVFRLVPPERRGKPELYTDEDRWLIAVMWIPTVVVLFFAVSSALFPLY
jgi:hypothetical protein